MAGAQIFYFKCAEAEGLFFGLKAPKSWKRGAKV